jgi:hypothetical protein
MKKAFYAGAEAMRRIQMHISGPDWTEEAAMAALDGVHDELVGFANQIKNGEV